MRQTDGDIEEIGAKPLSEKARTDFARLMGVFMLGSILIGLIVPISMVWFYVGVILVIMGYAMQLYWDRHFK